MICIYVYIIFVYVFNFSIQISPSKGSPKVFNTFFFKGIFDNTTPK